MQGGTITEKFVYWLFANRIPVTKLIIISNILTFFMIVIFKAGWLAEYLSFRPAVLFSMPWVFVTYPLINTTFSPINLIFQSYWMWLAGGSLERAWESRTFTIFLAILSAVSAAGILVGGILTGVPVGLSGLWIPLAGITVAFAMLNPEQEIRFFLIIPLKLKYLALISVGLVFISFGAQNPILGLFALTGCAFSYWYVRSGFTLDFNPTRREDRGSVVQVYRPRGLFSKLNPMDRLKDYREKKRLKDFFDKSGIDED